MSCLKSRTIWFVIRTYQGGVCRIMWYYPEAGQAMDGIVKTIKNGDHCWWSSQCGADGAGRTRDRVYVDSYPGN